MKYYVYINKSLKTGKYYTGNCKNVNIRLNAHNAGKTKSTKNGIPWITVRIEEYPSKQEAYRRERQIKSYKGARAFKELIND